MRIHVLTVLGVAMVMVPAAAAAQPQTTTASMTATVSTMAKLTVSSSALTFADANPDLVPQVPATQGALAIAAKARSTGLSQVVLTLQADDDLRSGLQTIPASAITWTATGSGFSAGTLSKLTPVPLGQWSGSGVRMGTQTFSFTNLWTYATGTYSCVLTYTLTAP